jgi:branched-chain amino acid transport system substrate-binding protein
VGFRIFLLISLLFFIAQVKSQQTEPVNIGLLIQNKESQAAKRGAALAITIANKNDGFKGRPFRLITRDMEGPWGTGSKQAVDLIFNEEVWALLGSHDGRNAHLVEQASAKSIVPFISAWSSDPTLSQAFIPWFFNCVPTDDQQAITLIHEIYSKRKVSKVATIADNSYDSNQSLKSFLKFLKKEGKVLPIMYTFEDYRTDLNILADEILKKEAECIVLYCRPSAALQIVRLFKERKMPQAVFSALSVINENELSEMELREFNEFLLIPAPKAAGVKAKFFREQYLQTYGILPGAVASYAFDGMNVLIEAIRISGSSEREKIQEAMAKIHFEGVTGLVQFDAMGNRQGIPVVSPYVTMPGK